MSGTMSKKEYITAINEILEKITPLWLLDMIYVCVVNVTKEE